MNPKALPVVLTRLGFTPNEVKCFLATLEIGPASAPDIAAEAKLDRSNVYRVLLSLTRRGLVTQAIHDGHKIFTTHPKKLTSLAADLRRKARKHEIQTEELVTELLAAETDTRLRPRVQFFEGLDNIIRVFDESLDEPGLTEILHCTSANFSLFPDIQEYDTDYIRRRIKRNIPIKILAPLSELSREWRKRDHLELRETRFIPPQYQFPSSVIINGNKVYIISHDEELVAIIIESEELSRMHRALFGYMWQHAEVVDPLTL